MQYIWFSCRRGGFSTRGQVWKVVWFLVFSRSSFGGFFLKLRQLCSGSPLMGISFICSFVVVLPSFGSASSAVELYMLTFFFLSCHLIHVCVFLLCSWIRSSSFLNALQLSWILSGLCFAFVLLLSRCHVRCSSSMGFHGFPCGVSIHFLTIVLLPLLSTVSVWPFASRRKHQKHNNNQQHYGSYNRDIS